MLVPLGTFFTEVEHGNGWGSLTADRDGIKIFVIGKLATKESADEIETYGVKVTGVPYTSWRKVDEGENRNGWTWYRTVEADYEGKTLLGGYGVGSKGSYMLVLISTSDDFETNEVEYRKWYESIQLLE